MFEAWTKTKYRLQVFKKTEFGYDWVKTLVIDPKKNEIEWNNKSFHYSLKEVSHRKGNKAFINKDIDNGQTVMKLGCDDWECPTDDVSPKAERRLAKAAVDNINQNYGLMMLIIVLAAGLLGGFLIGSNLPALQGMLGGQ